MASSSRGGGRGIISRGRGRILSPSISIDDDCFTLVTKNPTPKRSGYIGSSSCFYSQKSKEVVHMKETLANIVAKEDSEYISKNFPLHICYIEQEDISLTNYGWAIRLKCLTPYQTPSSSGKPMAYFEAIMTQTDSMNISHTRESLTDLSSAIIFSKCIIKKVIKPGSWGFDLANSKVMKIDEASQNYNYWDYQHGFYHTFLYQNKKNKHTWFFKLCNQIILFGGVPSWFYDWWLIYGPVLDILPSNILKAYHKWEVWHPLIRGKDNLPYNHNMVLFFIEFEIPWIWKWDFLIQYDSGVDIPTLHRVFWVRWWNNFSPKDIVDLYEQINKKTDEYFSKYQISNKKVSSFLSKSSFNTFDLLKDQIKSEPPNISKAYLMSKCMQFVKDQFHSLFAKGDSSMRSVKDSQENLLAGEVKDSQNPDEDITSKRLENLEKRKQLIEPIEESETELVPFCNQNKQFRCLEVNCKIRIKDFTVDCLGLVDTGCTSCIINKKLIPDYLCKKSDRIIQGQQMDGKLHSYDTELVPGAMISFKTNRDQFSTEYTLPQTWVRNLNVSSDFIIGLTFLLNQNGGIFISKDYLQLRKNTLFTPVESIHRDSSTRQTSEFARKRGGYLEQKKSEECKCKILRLLIILLFRILLLVNLIFVLIVRLLVKYFLFPL
ncbi:Reverse transcriptase/Ribonuclease [Actinidia chinensis var. chinensis]|uniref:Reverse transcriptase/Ribonuclease n=1 Tax=Actinidia chinensis var. chinensis TaxID=1590841 RepID=A0A2R6R8L0_ACTCC|nr:Reverse transcriptase/Ribonuclease [Actinidia chinensis var. chinensis]